MNEHLISDLSRFIDERGVTISQTPGHVRLSIARSNVSIAVLVPRGVLEWWVEVSTADGPKVEDWCDYAGYEDSPERELAEEMRADVLRFIENALVRPFRLASNGRALEWHVGENWTQAVPLVADADNGAVGDARNARD